MKMEYLLIRRKDDFCQNIDQFLNHLLSNGMISFSEEEKSDERVKGEIAFSKASLKCTIEYSEAIQAQENIFHMTAESMQGDKSVEILGDFDRIMRRINQETGHMFRMNTIWDDVSDYYRKALYPSITRIENLLRKIIYQFMIRNVGQSWFITSTPKEFKESVQKVAKEKEKITEEIEEDHLLHADFIQLGVFFFGTYTIKPVDINIVERVKKLQEKTDLTPEQYRTELLQMISDYESKSNWERFFSEEIKVERLLDKWNELYGYRNQVAHAKRMVKKEYDAAQAIIKSLQEAFEACLRRVDKINMTKEESEAVVNIAVDSILMNLKDKTINGIQLTREGSLLFESGTSRFTPSTVVNEDGTVSLKTQPVGIVSSGYFFRNKDGSISISKELLDTPVSSLPGANSYYVHLPMKENEPNLVTAGITEMDTKPKIVKLK